jgi:menaquinone-dependent protoporphyrinogen oxidase
LFSGVVSKDQFPVLSRVAFRLLGGRYGDHRDWDDIDRWADGIARTLVATAASRPPVRQGGGS